MKSHIPITLLFADGVSHRLDVPCGGKLIEAATAAGLNLLTDCSNGQCGTCTAQLLSGSVEMDDYDDLSEISILTGKVVDHPQSMAKSGDPDGEVFMISPTPVAKICAPPASKQGAGPAPALAPG